MIKVIAVAACFAVLSFHCSGQVESSNEKKYNHYIGFQANELMRQLINFDNTTTAVNNPYLVVYSINKTKTNFGLHAGLGFNYKTISDNDAGVGRETKVNDWFYRIGVERIFAVGKRFESSVSFDFTGSYKLDKTFSISVINTGSTIDSSQTTVTTKTTSWGFGPRGSLGFHITDKVILGTEATLYFNSQKLKENVLVINTVTDIFSNQQIVSTSNFNSETNTDEFALSIPIALFLIVKF